MTNSDSNPNAVVVGYGYAGRHFHTYLISLAAELNLYGIATRREEAKAQIEAKGVRVFGGFEEVLEEEAVDLVVLANPNDLHAPCAIRALEAGKHVVTDKPMCLNLAEADAMISAARKQDRLLSVFQNRRWDGDFLTVRKLLEEGRVGDPFVIEMAWMAFSPPRTWRAERAHGGGKFVDLGSHMIDQALLLVSASVERVFARFHGGGWNNDVEDHAHCVISFANGVEVRVETSSRAHQTKPRWLVFGSEGTVTKAGLDPQEGAMIACDIDAAREDSSNYACMFARQSTSGPQIIETTPGRWRSYYENVAAALKGRESLAVTAESVRRVVAVIGAAQRSAATQQVVEMAELLDR